MNHFIFQAQLEKAQEINKILDKYRDTKEWQISRNAFEQIVRKHLHGGMSTITEQELDKHFERALIITKKDVAIYQS